jgi:hypothetical protein
MEILKLWPIALFVLQGLGMWVFWSLGKQFVTRQALAKVEEKIDADRQALREELTDAVARAVKDSRSGVALVRGEVADVRKDVDDLHERVAKTATHEDVAALSRATSDIAGDLKGLTATVAGLAQGVNAIAENVNMLLRHHVERART